MLVVIIKWMEQAVDRKNRKNLSKLNSIISEYESKLDARVDQVVEEMINHTKKVTDPPLQPVLQARRLDHYSSSKQTDREKTKSQSYYADLTFLHDTSLQEEISQIRGTFKQMQSSKVIQDQGRAVGSHGGAKPKFAKRRPDILPREVRLNPLAEKNAIKAYELQKGLYSLIEKGKIGKDVNIITAFEKGKPVLQTQKAIFHQGQQRFAELDTEKGSQTITESTIKQNIKKVNKMNFNEPIYEQHWAITMPKESNQNVKLYRSKQEKLPLIDFKQQIYIKIVRYQVALDASWTALIRKHLEFKCEIRQILKHIIQVMKIYSIEIAYADSSKIMQFVTRSNKLSKNELLGCLAGEGKKGNLKSLKTVRGQSQKVMLAVDLVKSCLKFNVERKMFLKYLKKKQISNRIYWWAVSCWTVKKHKELIKERRREVQQAYIALQSSFPSKFAKIESEKHYEIHLINQTLEGKQNYKQFLNVQITRIFNLKNFNKSIIYLLPYALNEETVNYYYKIMELEEIPNFKDRVSFIEVDPNHLFPHNITLSTKLYYNSQTLRKLKKKIKDVPSYLVISYPSLVDVKIAAYLNVPILGGNLLQTLKLQDRSEVEAFHMTVLGRYKVPASHHQNLIFLSDELIQYCQTVKQTNKFLIKINGKYRSHGLALLNFPFSSLPEMYSSTTLISPHSTVDEFYHQLTKHGGIVEIYEQSVSVVGVVITISLSGEIKVIGNFEKISSGFINIGFIFPQKKIENKWLFERSRKVGTKLYEAGHFGSAELTFYINDMMEIYLEKVQCYLTHLGSSLFYYKFLSEGELVQNGDYLAKIMDIDERGGAQEQIITMEARFFCYIPFLLHFGLSDRQVNSFFQLCRMGGVSFDLQNKYGATFILLGSLKSSMGLITTAKDKRGAVKIMLKSLQFILKQNSHNMSSQTLLQKQVRMKQRENILNVKERLEDI